MPNLNKSIGITGYGAYIPSQYIDAHHISPQAKALGMVCKSRPNWDEDAVTMGVEAAYSALKNFNHQPFSIGAVYTGSESSPYAVKPISTIIADCLGLTNQYQAIDLQFACKAATTGIQLASQYVHANPDKQALVVGSDTSQAKTGDTLECTTGAGAAALVIGSKHVLAYITHTASFNSDTPDFWRRNNQPNPHHAGRFSGEPAYYYHIMSATLGLLKTSNLKPAQIDHVIFHMPNGKFPQSVATRLGFTPAQFKIGLVGPQIGNTYTASAILGLIAVLEKAKPNHNILLTSYGSGAGADSFLLKTTPYLTTHKSLHLSHLLANRQAITFNQYQESLKWH